VDNPNYGHNNVVIRHTADKRIWTILELGTDIILRNWNMGGEREQKDDITVAMLFASSLQQFAFLRCNYECPDY